jgi:hypothetical protein
MNSACLIAPEPGSLRHRPLVLGLSKCAMQQSLTHERFWLARELSPHRELARRRNRPLELTGRRVKQSSIVTKDRLLKAARVLAPTGSAVMDKIAITLLFVLAAVICLTVFHMADGKF